MADCLSLIRVSAGNTVTLLYADEQSMASSTSHISSPTVTVNGVAVAATVTPTSGQIPTYLNPPKGSIGNPACQDWITFKLPSAGSSKQYSISVTAYDSDNDQDTFSWTYSTPTPPPPPAPGIVTSQSLMPNDEGFVLNGQEATGTMTFKLYKPGDKYCTMTPVFSETVQVHNGIANTNNTSFIATAPGFYQWVIEYSGDSTHHSAKSSCGNEKFRIENTN